MAYSQAVEYYNQKGQDHAAVQGDETGPRAEVQAAQEAIDGGDTSQAAYDRLTAAETALSSAEAATAQALQDFSDAGDVKDAAQDALDAANEHANDLLDEIQDANSAQSIIVEAKDAIAYQAFVPEVQAQPAVPEVLAQAEIPEVLAQAEIPEVLAQPAIPAVEYQAAIPAVEYQAEIPAVEYQAAIPEVLAQDAIPEVLAVEAVAEIPPVLAASAIPAAVVVKYIIRTQYNESIAVQDESLLFANKTDAFDALELRTA